MDKLPKNISGAFGELTVARELMLHDFQIYFPYQGNNEDDDLTVVNNKTGNVYRIQIKTKQDKDKWSAVFFKNIKKKTNKNLIYALYELPTGKIFIVSNNDLLDLEANKKGFADKDEKYLNKWDLLK